MKHRRLGIFSLPLAVWVLTFSIETLAQKIKVDKIKGNKAIIEFTGALKEGEIFDLGQKSQSKSAEAEVDDDGPSPTIRNHPRTRLIGISGVIALNTYSASGASTSATLISIGGRYGWNKTDREYGGIATYSTYSANGNAVNSYLFGGFYDYNILHNKPSEAVSAGIAGEGGIGSSSTSVVGTGGSSSSSNSTWYLFPSGFIKWFSFGTTTCLRADAGFLYQVFQGSPSSSVTGITAKLGLVHYF